MFLLVDNYDSFTYNLYALLRSCGEDAVIIKNNEFIEADDFAGIIFSPGPSSPESSGTSLKYLETYMGKKPMFGVCLGMQCIAHAMGYPVIQAKTIKHGKVDSISAKGESLLLKNVPQRFRSVRYHSLAVDMDERYITSYSDSDSVPMSLEDPERGLFGVQFHPESVMSEHGATIMKNFIDHAKGASKKESDLDVVIKKVNSGMHLDMKEAEVLFDNMLGGSLTESQIGAALIAIKTRGETIDELAALVNTMNRYKVPFKHQAAKTIDTCGTGGDGTSTINISTAVSIVLAGMGYSVVKHGNKAQSGKVGSADILEGLGFDYTYSKTEADDFFARHNFVYMHAPFYHPALKDIGKVRRELKAPTLFNFAGPLVNPADPAYQIIGISNREKLVYLANVILKTGRGNITVYSSFDGYDEVSSADRTECIYVANGCLENFIIDPADFFEPFDMPRVDGSAHARELFLKGLRGEDAEIVNLLAINTALALYTMREGSLAQCFNSARESIMKGEAAVKLARITGNATGGNG